MGTQGEGAKAPDPVIQAQLDKQEAQRAELLLIEVKQNEQRKARRKKQIGNFLKEH